MAIHSGELSFARGAPLMEAPGGVRRRPSGPALTFDGRIDNGDELVMRLADGACDARDAAGLALAVFERWGIAGLESIVGDWAVAIWDAPRRTLHLARDYMGARPLYYCATERGASWSADLAGLVTRTGRSQQLSDAFAARFMSLSPHADATPYEDVRAVPPGVCVSIAGPGGVTRSRIWQLGAGEIRYRDPRTYEEQLRALWREAVLGGLGAGEIRYRDPRTYEEQLRALWREAVLSRLRATDIVWAELSGGLDSSSVVCMAGRLIASGAAAVPALRLVSHATLQSPEGDERRFIAEVERQVGVRSEIVGVEDHQEQTDPERAWLTPYALQGVGLETVRRVQAGGGRMVLSGRFGDAVMGCQPDNSLAVLDDVRRGRMLAALQNLRAWSRATREPFIAIACRLLAADRPAAADTGLELLTPRLRAMRLDVPRLELPRGIRRSKRPLARMILGYAGGARLDIPHRSPDVVYTYPFTHRPLVDFMLAIPAEELSAPGRTRALMRRAFAGFVPSRVIRRISKGYYPPAAYRAARRLVASISVPDLEVVERGWIDPDRLQAAIFALTDGGGETGGDIHAVLRLEAWLQARRRHHCGSPQRKEVNSHDVLHA